MIYVNTESDQIIIRVLKFQTIKLGDNVDPEALMEKPEEVEEKAAEEAATTEEEVPEKEEVVQEEDVKSDQEVDNGIQ